MDIAIITGASSGLGQVFYEQMVGRYPQLDEIWLIARREERLQALARQFPQRKVRVLSLDLADQDTFVVIDQLLAELQPTIKVLINNAGFDRAVRFREMATSDILAMINLNITGMTLLNRVCLPYMQAGSYEIISGSVGSFVPLPWRAVYSATKVYGRFFARALREEERQRGVNILYLAPGNMDTEMNRRGEVKGVTANHPYLDLPKETVKAMEKAEKGKAIYTPMAFYKAYRLLGKLLPSALMVKFTSVESVVKCDEI